MDRIIINTLCYFAVVGNGIFFPADVAAVGHIVGVMDIQSCIR